jgi:hypothetical protein
LIKIPRSGGGSQKISKRVFLQDSWFFKPERY